MLFSEHPRSPFFPGQKNRKHFGVSNSPPSLLEVGRITTGNDAGVYMWGRTFQKSRSSLHWLQCWSGNSVVRSCISRKLILTHSIFYLLFILSNKSKRVNIIFCNCRVHLQRMYGTVWVIEVQRPRLSSSYGPCTYHITREGWGYRSSSSSFNLKNDTVHKGFVILCYMAKGGNWIIVT